jgi:hypothetical protein
VGENSDVLSGKFKGLDQFNILAYCILYPHYRGHSKLFEPLPGISRLSLT